MIFSSFAPTTLSHIGSDTKFQFMYSEQMPAFMAPYVARVNKMRGDGNCGFRAIAKALSNDPAFISQMESQEDLNKYVGEDGWFQVRKDLLHELVTHPTGPNVIPPYGKHLGGEEVVQETKDALTVRSVKTRVGKGKWLNKWNMGYIIANAYNWLVIFLHTGHSNTFLTNCLGPPDPHPHNPIVLCQPVSGDHWDHVELQEVDNKAPYPPVYSGWNKAKNSLPAALQWERDLRNHFTLWRALAKVPLKRGGRK